MKRVLTGALAGGVVLFAWQFASWMFLGIHEFDHEPALRDEAAVVAALAGNPKGVYWIPYCSPADQKAQNEAYKAFVDRHEKGPIAWINYDPVGKPPMSPKTLAIGGALAIAIAFVAAAMLRAAKISSFFGRFLFVAALGLFLALAMDGQGWNWMNHPLDWTRGFVIDHLAGMAAVGVVLGLLVRPN